MTDLLETPAPTGDVTVPRSRPARRVLVVGSMAAVVAIGVAVALAVLAPPLEALRSTSVLLDARPFVCKDPTDVTTYTSADDGTDDGVVVPAVRLHPGLDCTMSVVVRNDSDLDVSVDRITIPLLGANSSVGAHADLGLVQGIAPNSGPDAVDAVFDYEHDPRSGSFPVGAHAAQRFTFHLGWSDGCLDDDSAEVFTQAPTVVLSAGPWHAEHRWDGAGYAFLGGAHSVAASCTR